MTALLVALLLGPPDTLLVSVELVETSQRVLVEAVLADDSTLHLPAEPVGQLLGVTFPVLWISVEQLQQQYPTLTVAWLPLEMRVVILDPLRVLPASREAQQRIVARTRLAFNVPVRSGPFLSLTADDRGEHLTDIGYSFRGRASATLRQSSTRGSAWALTLAPSPRLYLTVADGDQMQPTASARLAAGPAWAFATWTPQGFETDGLLQVGRVSLFASTREIFAVTINAAPVGVQVGRQGNTTTARLTYGPVMPSPFTVPTIP